MGERAAAWRGGRWRTGWRGARRRWLLPLAGLVVIALAAYGVVHALTAGASVRPKPPATAIADEGAVTTEVATTGTLRPAQTRSLSFAVSGTVQSIGVRAGTTVTPGQVLARVDDTNAIATVNSAQNALDDAEDALTTARASAAKAAADQASADQAGADRSSAACAGVNVPAGYPSAPVTPTSTASPRPTVTHASPSRTTSPSRTARPGRTATPTATCGRSGGSSSGSGRSGSGQIGSGQSGGTDAVYSAQRRVTQATVALENAQDALDGTTITAPIAGRILSVAGQVGGQVGAGSAFITLADVYDMQISAAFPEADADRLAVKQKASVTLADRAGQTFRATVVQVDPVGTSDGTMVRYGVLLSFDNAPKELLVGQSANVRVTTGAADGVLRVPSTAVHDVAGTTGTVLRPAGGVTTRVKVGIGLRGDQYTQITSGLAGGDTVVRSW